MEKKEGKHLCNARVDVDYSSGKPKIKFKYPGKNPKKDSAQQGGIFWIAMIIFLLIGITPYMIHEINSSEAVEYPSNCGNLSFNELHFNWTTTYQGFFNHTYQDSTDVVYGFNLTCDNKIHQFSFNVYGTSDSNPQFEEKKDYKKIRENILWFFWLIISLYISLKINTQITKRLVKKKWYQKWLPKANADGILFKKKKKKYYKYKPEDMTGNVIVIPRFSNVELDYITAGDFGSKLKSITIREYKQRTINIKTKKKSKDKVEHFKWYAVFEFTSKPKKGFLEVIYQ